MIGLVFKNKNELKQALLDNIKNVSISCFNKVDRQFHQKIDGIINQLTETYWILNFVTNYTDIEINEIKFDSKLLLWQGANSLVGALQLIRLGYFVEPNFLERHAIENLAIALVLFRDYRKYKEFNSGKLSGDKCIGEAKNVISQIGQIYGVLSDITHPSKKWLGTYVAEKRKTLLIGGGIVDEHIYRAKLNLATLGFLCSVYHSGVELIFYDFIENPKFWKKKSSDTFEWEPSENEKEYGRKTATAMLEVIKEFNTT